MQTFACSDAPTSGVRVLSVQPVSVFSSFHSPLPTWLTRALLTALSPLLGLTAQAREAARTAVWLAGAGARDTGATGVTWRACEERDEGDEGDMGGLWRSSEDLIHRALA